MKTCYTDLPRSSDSVTFRPGPGFWVTVPQGQRDDLIRHHVQRALRLVADHHLPLPASLKRFELVVLLAVEAELLFFNAALSEPSSADCDTFFTDFLAHALTPSPNESSNLSGTCLQID